LAALCFCKLQTPSIPTPDSAVLRLLGGLLLQGLVESLNTRVGQNIPVRVS
jgi:hypothetical protein